MYLSQKANKYRELQQACLLEVAKVFKLITHILLAASNSALVTGAKVKWSTQEAIDMVINYIEWRYKDEITLTTLAEMVYLTPSYLIRIFKEHTGYAPIEYLQMLRMNAAASYLERTNLPMKVIIEKTGFNSVQYFCRLFKNKYGESPGQWRMKQRALQHKEEKP
ncbi:AraC family transcriptional regulator [Paenibacillaceae bacterium]|nr:AraC family transcriptional regulator [Paenibacillaceae bacterium]